MSGGTRWYIGQGEHKLQIARSRRFPLSPTYVKVCLVVRHKIWLFRHKLKGVCLGHTTQIRSYDTKFGPSETNLKGVYVGRTTQIRLYDSKFDRTTQNLVAQHNLKCFYLGRTTQFRLYDTKFVFCENAPFIESCFFISALKDLHTYNKVTDSVGVTRGNIWDKNVTWVIHMTWHTQSYNKKYIVMLQVKAFCPHPKASLEDVLAAISLWECYPMTSGWHCLKNSFIGCQIKKPAASG
jgi:hypothetical protein